MGTARETYESCNRRGCDNPPAGMAKNCSPRTGTIWQPECEKHLDELPDYRVQWDETPAEKIVRRVGEIAERNGFTVYEDLAHGQHQWIDEDDGFLIHLFINYQCPDQPESARIGLAYAEDGETACQFDRPDGRLSADEDDLNYLDWFLRARWSEHK